MEKHWLPAAKALQYGGRGKINCCGSSPSMSISHNQYGYNCYCHRCGEKDFEPHGKLSIADLLQRKRVVDEIISSTIKLPKDFTLDIPAEGAIWLLKGGVPLSIAREYNIGYSEYWRRVIVPIYKDKELIGFNARSTIGEKPKYLMRIKDDERESAVFISNPALRLASAVSDPGLSSIAAVVSEDVLSSIRCGRLAPVALALLGTSKNSSKTARVLAEATRRVGSTAKVCVWLDGDKAGVGASKSICKTLSLYGMEVKEIVTPKDPKLYSNREIKEILLS